MALSVPMIITTEANDNDNAGPSLDSHLASTPFQSPSLAINVESPAEDNDGVPPQPLSPIPLSVRSQLSPVSPIIGNPLLRVPSVASHASSSAQSSDGPLTPSFDSESAVDPHIHSPSPTFTSASHASAYEQHNATKLRGNNPDFHSGRDSLQLLKPGKGLHNRSPSWTTAGEESIGDVTEPDHGGPTGASDLGIEEQARTPSLASSGRAKTRKNGKGKGAGDSDGSSSDDLA